MTTEDSQNDERDASESQRPELRVLVDVVGVDLVAFMLALNPADVWNDSVLAGPRTAVAEDIWTAAMGHTRPIKGSRHPWKTMREASRIDAFCRYDESRGTSAATDFHLRSGGIRPAIGGNSSLDDCLQLIAMDCFAARLIGSEQTHHSPSLVDKHPLMPTVRRWLRNESEPLTQLLRDAFAATDEADLRGRDRVTYNEQIEVDWSTGGGGSLSLRDIGTHIISSLLIDEDLDARVLIRVAEAVRDGLGRARRLAAGETVPVKTLIALGDLTLPRGAGPIEIAGGRIRRPTVLDRRLNSFAAEPDLILEVDQPVRFIEARLSPPPVHNGHEQLTRFVASSERRKKFLPELIQASEDHQETIRRVRFAIVLASPNEEVFRPVWRFTRQNHPLTSSGSNSHQPNPSPGVVKTQLPPQIDAGTAVEIAEWAKKMAGLPDALKVGRRRLLKATTDRPDPLDKFIDAVIVWESMFGTETETSFRVTGSMALLLEPENIEARKALHKRLSDLYSHRSKLVHGAVGHDRESSKFKMADVPEHANDAVRYAIDCFKRILDDKGLFPLDSAARSKRIMLGF